jgi:hypothetical protein
MAGRFIWVEERLGSIPSFRIPYISICVYNYKSNTRLNLQWIMLFDVDLISLISYIFAPTKL